MSRTSTISAVVQRLSPRERLLGGIALVLVLVIGLVYGGLMPGMNAARSAATRYVDAAADLALIRSLAPAAGIGAPGVVDAGLLRQSAEQAGLVVIDEKPAESGLTMIVSAPAPQPILSWLAANSSVAPVDSFVIEASGDGVTGHVRFIGATP